MRRLALWLIAASVCLLSPVPGTAAPAKHPRVHRVAKGQTLGRIAKRYQVSIGALCHANGITRKHKLRPGTSLIVPSPSDKDGSEARKQREVGDGGDKRAVPARPAPAAAPKHRWHQVVKGQRLGSIARRYHVSIGALAHANDIAKSARLKVGTRLVVPERDDKDGSQARAARFAELGLKDVGSATVPPSSGQQGSWSKYLRKPVRPGWVSLVGRTQRWRGPAIAHGKVSPEARAAFRKILAAADGQQLDIHPRLVLLLAHISDTFGGRTIRVVSGYRLGTTSETSRHRHGRAVDVRVDGIPPEALRDFVKTFDKVGVGWYPKSQFVHLDVRARWTYWIDNAGHGQPPQYLGFWTKHNGREVRSQ